MRHPLQLAAGLAVVAMFAAGVYLALTSAPESAQDRLLEDDSQLAEPEAEAEVVAGAPAGPSLDDSEAEGASGASERLALPGETPARPAISLRIEGRVLGPAGQGVPDAEVQVGVRPRPQGEQRGRGWRGDGPNGGGRPLRTDASGSFTLETTGFEATLVEVSARAAGFAPNLVYREWEPPRGVLKVDVDLVSGATVIGRVTSTAGAPLAATVRFRPEDKPSPWRWADLVGIGNTAANGSFELRDVPPGKFVLVVEASKYVPASTAPTECKPSARMDVGTVVLEGGVELTGLVLDLAGQPIADAAIDAFVARGVAEQRARQELEREAGRPGIRNPDREREVMRRLRDQMLARRRARTNADGEFALDGLPRQALRVEVRHEQYLDEIRVPVEGGVTARLEIRLHRRLAIKGQVTDAGSGQPILEFGIQARRIQDPAAAPPPGKPGGEARDAAARLAEMQAQEAQLRQAQAEAQAALARFQSALDQERDAAARVKLSTAVDTARQRAAQVTAKGQRLGEERARLQVEQSRRQAEEQQRQALQVAQRQANDAWLAQRLGSSRQVPGPTPPPTAHEAGAFVLEGLQPGTYVLDVAAPGYVKLAAGPITLRREVPLTTFSVYLERGAEIEGVVLDRANGAPVAGAEITVFVPPREPQPPSPDPLMQALRPPDSGLRLDKVTAGGDGAFRVPAQRAGSYKLVVKAEGFGSLAETLAVPPGQRVSGVVLQLGKSARIHGRVANLRPNEKVQVVMASTAGQRRFADIAAPSGDYEARDLEPGDWFVRVHHPDRKGGPFRQLMEALVRPGKGRPDVRLVEGADMRLDLDAADEDLGGVVGSVSWNGAPARGFEVRLRPTNPEVLPKSSDPEGQQMLRRMLTNALRATTNEHGRFEISMVPPGPYLLEVGRDGALGNAPDPTRAPPKSPGGRGGSNSLVHRQELFVHRGQPTPAPVFFETGHLRLTLVDAQSGKPANGTRVVMALASEVTNPDPRTWRSLPSTRQINARGGIAEARDVTTGDYVYSVFGGGAVAQTGRIYVASGSTAERRLSVQRASPPSGGARTAPGPGQKK